MKEWYRVGVVNKFSERHFAAQELAGSYERERWRWVCADGEVISVDTTLRTKVPGKLDIQQTIDKMMSLLGEAPDAAVQTGGLKLAREAGDLVLYCEEKLKPVTKAELKERDEV